MMSTEINKSHLATKEKLQFRPSATNSVKCAIVPLELMNEIQDVIKEAPYKQARNILEKIATVPVQDVEVKPPND